MTSKEKTISALSPTPSAQESEMARESSRRLAALLGARGLEDEGATISVRIGDEDEPHEVVALPVSVLQMLTRLLGHMAQGQLVQMLPIDTELSSFEAANVLGVSRPYLIKLLDEGAFSFRRVGTHRRVLLRDVLEYKRADDLKRQAVLAELVAEAQELDMGY